MSSQLQHAVRDGITRTVAIGGLTGVALIHLLDAPGKFTETPYLGWLYVGLIAGCLLVAGALVRTSDRRAWAAAAALPASAIVGYVLARTTGLPQATGDIGNWSEPLGMASLFIEGSLVALSGSVLASRAAAASAEVRQAHPARRVAHRISAITLVAAMAIAVSSAPAWASPQPPTITRTSTRTVGQLVYLYVTYTDPNNDAIGFGFRGARGAGWGEETHLFSDPSYGLIYPQAVAYPFNLACGTPSQYQSDVEFWIFDATGLRSRSVTPHITC